jgi:hypothetical protein
MEGGLPPFCSVRQVRTKISIVGCLAILCAVCRMECIYAIYSQIRYEYCHPQGLQADQYEV